MENKNWFNMSVEETIDELKTDANQGLSGQEVEKRKAEKKPICEIFRTI